jgi:hypothetical protein
MCRVPTLMFLCLLAVCGTASAAIQPNSGDSLPPVRAFRLTSPVTIDGALLEAAWQGAPSATRFVQGDPVEGAAPSESTWVWLAYDDDALYIAARCWDSHPDSIIANLARRDLLVPSDRFLVMLDPYHDHRSGYFFSVSAAGVLRDGTLMNDTWNDESWDGFWQGRARRDGGTRGGGWTVEMRIPFSQLRYRAGAEQVWGINLRRRIERRNEEDYLVYQPKSGAGYVSRFPHLVGLQNGHARRSIELVPYATGKADYLAHALGDPFHDGSSYKPGLGADLRASVGNNLTLNTTVNPDFGQVEVDPAVVNLSDVESYYSEKRPFFTENASIFSTFGNEGSDNYWGFNWSSPTFFYTRRIGRGPQGTVPGGSEFSDVPMATHILGAAKLTGKLAPSLSFGMLSAVTSREDARYALGGLESKAEVEPLTYYGVTRGLKEFKDGFNGLGAMATLAQRRFDGGGLEDALSRQSLMAGLDGWHFFDRKKVWVVSGWAGLSRVAGTPERMIDLQRAPQHYLQRPDVGYLGVDSSATSLAGWGGRLTLNKQKGNVLSNSAIGVLSPKFDVGDVGFLSRTDVINLHTGWGYKWTKPNHWRRYANVIAAAFQTRDFGGVPNWEGLWGDAEATFVNNWYAGLNGAWNPPVANDRWTRGGPRMRTRNQGESNFSLTTDSKNRLYYELGAYYSGSTDGSSHELTLNPYVAWKPASNVTLSAGPGYDRTVEDAQYVDQFDAPGEVPADFGGRRYVFARLDQRTVSANIRLDISFTPNLSLQTYLQPLISAGSYGDFKELARSGSYSFVHYGAAYDAATDTVTTAAGTRFRLGDPSFNIKSLRGNAVLRWEYRPGSVLYFVWTQQRSDYQDVGDLNFGPSTRRLLDAHANDVFLVKVTYYLDL